MKDALISYAAPAKRELVIGFAAIAFLLAVGRFVIGSGSGWSIAALVATGAFFGIAAHRVRAVRALDVPVRTWFTGFAILAVGWSLALSLIATASAWISWRDNPWYTSYDAFVITSGNAPFADTNGEPYMVDHAGTNPWTWAVTFLVLFVCFVMASAIGSALGTMASAWGAVTAISTATLTIVALFVATLGLGIGAAVDAPYPGVFIFCIPIAAVAMAVNWASAKRLEP